MASKFSISLAGGLLLAASSSYALTVCMQMPTENVDGSALTDLNGGRVYLGASTRNYTQAVQYSATVPGADICVDFKVAPGWYYVAATALDRDGNESAYSNERRKQEIRGLDTPGGGRTIEAPTGGRLIP